MVLVPLSKLKVDGDANVRKSDRDTAALVASIKQFGLLQPPGVRRIDEHPYEYELVFGYGRIEAIQLLGWTEFEGGIIENDGEPDEQRARAWFKNLSENIVRKDLQQWEVDRAFSEGRKQYDILFRPTGKKKRSKEDDGHGNYVEWLCGVTGYSKSSIYAAMKRGGEACAEETWGAYSSGKIESYAVINLLVQRSHDEQREILPFVLGKTIEQVEEVLAARKSSEASGSTLHEFGGKNPPALPPETGINPSDPRPNEQVPLGASAATTALPGDKGDENTPSAVITVEQGGSDSAAPDESETIGDLIALADKHFQFLETFHSALVEQLKNCNVGALKRKSKADLRRKFEKLAKRAGSYNSEVATLCDELM